MRVTENGLQLGFMCSSDSESQELRMALWLWRSLLSFEFTHILVKMSRWKCLRKYSISINLYLIPDLSSKPQTPIGLGFFAKNYMLIIWTWLYTGISSLVQCFMKMNIIRQPSFGIQWQITEVYIHTMNNITSHSVVFENVHLQPEISQVQNTDQINIKNAIYWKKKRASNTYRWCIFVCLYNTNINIARINIS